MSVFLGLAALFVIISVTVHFIWICMGSSKMPSIIDENAEPQLGFWQRQFQPQLTPKQQFFDWTFGIILPVICFTFDPFVFNGEFEFSAQFKPFAYLLSFVSIMAMMAWLIWGAKLKWLNRVLAGLFAVGGIISLGIGIVLFPFSLIGLIVLIGALGFTPLLTGFVYLRNAVRAYRSAELIFNRRQLIATSTLSAIFSFVVPFTINMEIEKLLEKMQGGDANIIRQNAQILKIVAPITNFRVFRRNYHALEYQPDRQQALADAYRELTGKDIDEDWLID